MISLLDQALQEERANAMALAGAIQFLETALVDGPRQASEVLHEARSCGILFSSPVDAAKVVGVVEQWDPETSSIVWE